MTWLGADELDLLVLGSGVAGLSAAVRAADELALRVGVLTKAELSQAATRWAQGGVAAVLAGDPDSTDLHLADTLSAGAGLCDVDAVRVLVDEGPSRVNELIAMGAMFDRDREGRLQLAREGGHSLPRVVHAGGAATGAEIERALVEEVRETAVACWEQWFALDLLVDGGRCVRRRGDGPGRAGHRDPLPPRPAGHRRRGPALRRDHQPPAVDGRRPGHGPAGRAWPCADIEFVQFHPTALLSPKMPRPLLSEALRGHGALIRDLDGKRFVDELQPRDVVARAITAQDARGGRRPHAPRRHRPGALRRALPHHRRRRSAAPASTRPGTASRSRPPRTTTAAASSPTSTARPSLPGLWAAGEVACTGVHGANRLRQQLAAGGHGVRPRVDRGHRPGRRRAVAHGCHAGRRQRLGRRRRDRRAGGRPAGRAAAPSWTRPTGPRAPRASCGDRLQRAMTSGAGVLRDARSLRETGAVVAATLDAIDGLPKGPEREELRNLATVGWALLRAAEVREESRGCHTRDDFPDRDPAFQLRLVLR